MPICKMAIISDIHSNIHALDAVLDDIRDRSIKKIINLGDSFYGPLFPDLTANRLMELDIINIMGNQDRVLLQATNHIVSPTHKYVIETLSTDYLTWIASFHSTLAVSEDIYVCHGSPTSDEIYLLEKVTEKGVEVRDSQDIMTQTVSVDQSLIICGHSHIPRTIYLPNGKTIVNAGSVGLQAYSDDLPFVHKMETYSPYAKYVIITCRKNGWIVEHISIPYDWNKASRQALKNNRNDWARGIETGRT